MKLLHLTQKDYTVAKWSGGTTTQLLIWPEGADYARREFTFRISSATVEPEESDFTPLAGVRRYITPLRGGFTLTHPDGEPVVLGPMAEPYCFLGETPTHCVGRATDLNLMLKGVAGEMTLRKGTVALFQGFWGVYAHEDRRLVLEGETVLLKKGELLAIFADGPAELCLGEDPMLICRVDI